MKKLLLILLTSLLCLSLTSTVFADTGDFYVDTELVSDDLATYLEKIAQEERQIDRTVYITLANNIDLNSVNQLVIANNCSVEIDLNGFNITNSKLSKDRPMIENNGALTIIDKKTGGKVFVNTSDYQSSLIHNKGTFCLEKAELSISNANAAAVAIVNGQDSLNNNCKTYINKGIINTNSNVAIKQVGFDNTYDSLIKIIGASITAKLTAIETYKPSYSYNTSLIIDGGNFVGNLDVSSTKCVSNASFNSRIPEELVAEGYSQVRINDSKYSISTDYEARIDNNYYGNAVDALNAAKEDQTVTILKDVTRSDLDVIVPSKVTLDLNGHNLTYKSVSYLGYIKDSSEIIDDVLYFYGRPQGSVKISQVSYNDKYLLRNLSTTSTTIGDKYKLPVYFKDINCYKFYTLSDITAGIYNNDTKDFRFRPIIGFSPNGVWKEILCSNTDIKVGTTIKLSSDVKLLKYGFTEVKNLIFVFYDLLLQNFANYCGYGRFTIKFAFTISEKTSSATYNAQPLVYDGYNSYIYYANEISSYTINK